MLICEMCGENESSITKCKTCGLNFCEYCGEVEAKQCIECFNGSDDDYGDDDDDDDNDADWR